MLPTNVLLKKCRQVSLNSLLLGTAMLVLFFFSNDLLVALTSAALVFAIGAYNLKLLLELVWRGRKEKQSRKALLQTGLLMSLNIPVALLYAKLVLVLSTALLVRLVNDTKEPLRQLVVMGCGKERPLADLQPGQATVLWLPISPNCRERAVWVQYAAGRTTQRAFIDGYVVEGRRINVELGSSQQVAVTNR